MSVDISDIEVEMADSAAMLALMRQDKKVVGGQLNCIMDRAIGQSFLTSKVPPEVVLSVLQDATGFGAE